MATTNTAFIKSLLALQWQQHNELNNLLCQHEHEHEHEQKDLLVPYTKSGTASQALTLCKNVTSSMNVEPWSSNHVLLKPGDVVEFLTKASTGYKGKIATVIENLLDGLWMTAQLQDTLTVTNTLSVTIRRPQNLLVVSQLSKNLCWSQGTFTNVTCLQSMSWGGWCVSLGVCFSVLRWVSTWELSRVLNHPNLPS